MPLRACPASRDARAWKPARTAACPRCGVGGEARIRSEGWEKRKGEGKKRARSYGDHNKSVRLGPVSLFDGYTLGPRAPSALLHDGYTTVA